MKPPIIVSMVLALVLSAVAPAQAQWLHDPFQPLTVCNVHSANQAVRGAVADGSGGAFVFFLDARAGNDDVYATHVLVSGALDPLWPAAGLVVCNDASSPTELTAISDGLGGAWVGWIDARSGAAQAYVSRVQANGTIASGVTANGTRLTPSSTQAQSNLSLTADATAGLFVTYEFAYGPSDHDIGTARLGLNNLIAWSGVAANSSANQTRPRSVLTPSELIVGYVETDSTLMIARINRSTGTLIAASSQITSLVGDYALAYDGETGVIIGASAISIGKYALYMQHFYPGVVTYGYLYGSGAVPYSMVAIVPGTSGRFWFSYTNSNDLYAFPLTLANSGPGPIVKLISGGIYPVVASDGRGGLLAAQTSGWAQSVRLMANGQIAPLFAAAGASGLPTMQRRGFVYTRALVADGDGGLLLFGDDQIAGATPYSLGIMQHVDKWGAFNGEPSGLAVKDVAADQGGKVRLTWNASYLDAFYPNPISQYRVWRQVVASPALAARPVFDPEAPAVEEPVIGAVRYAAGPNATTIAWEYLGAQPANALPQYSFVAGTGQDSVGTNAYDNAFMVEALHGTYGVTWQSSSVTGHSVDNLPPVTPAPFAGAVIAGATNMHWGPNHEPDLAGYRVYRGTSAAFVPSPANRVTETPDTTAIDAGVGYWYKLSAIDTHGNESGYALLSPTGTLDAPGDVTPRELALTLASANPVRGSVALRMALPHAGAVRVAVYDVRGRIVRVLDQGARDPGTYALRWDGRDASGAAAGQGVFFARLEADGRVLTQRLVRLD